MTRPVVVLVLSFLLLPSAFAATADLSVRVGPPLSPDALAQHNEAFPVTVRNDGPDDATQVHLILGATGQSAQLCNGGDLFRLEANHEATIYCFATPPGQARTATFTAHIESPATDPDLSNNDSSVTFEWITAANLQVDLPRVTLDPGLPNDLVVRWRNLNPFSVGDALLGVTLPPDVTLLHPPANCNQDGTHVTCFLADLAPGRLDADFVSLHLTVVPADRREGAAVTIRASIFGQAPEADPADNLADLATFIYRTFVVDTMNDSGSGSLRSAIDATNAGCTDEIPCKIAFRLGTPGNGGFFMIAPESPLPVLHRNIAIDGSTQTRLTGDTNPDGPEIFLDGSKLTSGNGLTASCVGELTSLAIGNFPNNGLYFTPLDAGCAARVAAVRSSYVGVEPHGRAAAPNDRGVFLERGFAGLAITDNVISGNRHSGIFQSGGKSFIERNVIGLDARHAAPLGNGASGIYVGGPLHDFAAIRGNYIAFNHDFGVAVAPQSTADIFPNAIFANWQLGIDRGLDGPTTSSAPVVTSAAYDPATNTTSVDLTFDFQGTFAPSVHVYAADAPHGSRGEGQYYLGTVYASRSVVHFVTPGDWRGKWISATVTLHIYDGGPGAEFLETTSNTSEFSNAVQAQ